MEKACSKCKAIKPLTEFAHYGKPVPKPRSECRECSRAMCRSYKARNREKISAYNKVYKAEHVEEISDYNREYHAEHKEEIHKRHRARANERIKTDKQYALSLRLRDKVRTLLKQKPTKEGMRLTGCNQKFFKAWLEYQFDDNMTWETYGKSWCLDHVKPCCSFDLIDAGQQLKCFHWSNTRPLDKLTNHKKTGKVKEDEILAHRDICIKFLSELEDNPDYIYTTLD